MSLQFILSCKIIPYSVASPLNMSLGKFIEGKSIEISVSRQQLKMYGACLLNPLLSQTFPAETRINIIDDLVARKACTCSVYSEQQVRPTIYVEKGILCERLARDVGCWMVYVAYVDACIGTRFILHLNRISVCI